MTRPQSKAARRQRRRGDLPAGFAWRASRPRWIPSPTRRRQGWKAIDLKDARGGWLPLGEAVRRAEAIAAAVAAWAQGEPVPAQFVAIAPKGAGQAGKAAATVNPRAIGTLLDDYYAAAKFKRLATKTQADYRSKLGRFLEALVTPDDQAGDAGDREAKVTQAKALPVDVLQPPAFGEEGEFELERCYELLASTAGVSMAYGVHAAVSAWLSWCVKKKRIWQANPCSLVERVTPTGRIVVYDWPELVALIRAADAMGRPSIGDALALAVDLSWSEQDLLAVTWCQVSADCHCKHRRIKTGNAGNPKLLELGRRRLGEVRARWRAANVELIEQRPVLVCEMTGEAWVADTFRHAFAEVRAEAAKALPGVAFKQFRDTRDTAITYAYEAGLDVPGICSRTLHSPDRAQAVIAKHYGAIRQGLADDAAEKLDAHYARMGYTLDQQLALPAPGGS